MVVASHLVGGVGPIVAGCQSQEGLGAGANLLMGRAESWGSCLRVWGVLGLELAHY